jgi:hypothetical protein
VKVAWRAALAAAVVLGLLTGCTNQPTATSASPNPSTVATPHVAGPSPSASQMTVAAAASLIRATVAGANPLLLPTAIPADWSAVVTNLSPSFFDVSYTSPDGGKSVDLGIVVPNPPPPGPHGSQSAPRFHGDIHSLYQVDDTTVATSPRFLMWNEPGTWAMPNGLPGVPYLMSTTGLTDAEFWAMANSSLK